MSRGTGAHSDVWAETGFGKETKQEEEGRLHGGGVPQMGRDGPAGPPRCPGGPGKSLSPGPPQVEETPARPVNQQGRPAAPKA